MAERGERSYLQFNFLVDLGAGDGPEAGFQEVSGIDMDVAVAEYRSRDTPVDSLQKITGLNKSTDVTFKRGVIRSLSFDRWLNDIRSGTQHATRTVTIVLQKEDHRSAVRRWKLIRARIIKHTSGPFNARGTD